MKKTINIGGKLVDLSTPKVMGILNVTPDSFYGGSRVQQLDEVYRLADKMLSEGAVFLDVGGHSTRPNAEGVSETEELRRVLPVIEMLQKRFQTAIISIDTFRASVAQQSVAVGAQLINDISGGNLDEKMFETVAQLQVPYILMHSRGNPGTMSQLTNYENVTLDVIREVQAKVVALRAMGVKDIVVDPGFGFAKTALQGFEMLGQLPIFDTLLEMPILVGISRKSMIWRSLNITADEALNGTSVLNTIALLGGANILRVHDVKEAIEVISLVGLVQ
jgi:dihydropteroate synthase